MIVVVFDPAAAERVDESWSRRAGWGPREAIDVGRMAYEALPVAERPRWAGRLLRLCLSSVPEPALEVVRVADIAEVPGRWSEARDAFEAVRGLVLQAGEEPAASADVMLFHVAETVAMLTYNATGSPAPYDYHAGWRLLVRLRDFLAATHADEDLVDRVRLAIVDAS